jgi:hypothetical protein
MGNILFSSLRLQRDKFFTCSIPRFKTIDIYAKKVYLWTYMKKVQGGLKRLIAVLQWMEICLGPMLWFGKYFRRKKTVDKMGDFDSEYSNFWRTKWSLPWVQENLHFLQKNVENYDLNIDPWSYFSLVDRPLVIFFLQIAKKQKQNWKASKAQQATNLK